MDGIDRTGLVGPVHVNLSCHRTSTGPVDKVICVCDHNDFGRVSVRIFLMYAMLIVLCDRIFIPH